MKKTKIFKIDPLQPFEDKIEEAAQILKSGGIIAFPTETVYGLAVVINDSLAVEKLRMVKKRAVEKNFSICIHSFSQVEEFASELSPLIYRLMKRFWPGALTLVLKSKGGEMVGLRMPDHPVAKLLLEHVGIPIYAPSANVFGEEPPVCAEDVLRSLDGKIDAVIDSGETKWGVSSTVCKVIDNEFMILRQGAIHEEMIKAVARDKNILFVCTGNSCRSPMAEGLMKEMVKGNAHFTISSAGVSSYEGMPATKEAVIVMRHSGVDISAHISRRLTAEMVKQADYILVMEAGHKLYITTNFPCAQKRVFLLKEFLPENDGSKTIPDPIGMNINYYKEVALVIKKSIEGLVAKLK